MGFLQVLKVTQKCQQTGMQPSFINGPQLSLQAISILTDVRLAGSLQLETQLQALHY